MARSSATRNWSLTIFTRVSVIVVSSLAFLVSAMVLESQRPALYRIAEGMQGEQWYRIDLHTDHVGFMYNNAYQDHRGQWHFVSTTHFLLEDNAPNTLTKHLVFAANAPHPLIRARYSNQGRGQQLQATVQQQEAGYRATVERSTQSEPTTVPLDWSFDLPGFLAFEHWLATEQPRPEQQHVIASPDFERLRMQRRTYRVVEENSEGYLVENNAPLAASQTQLNQLFKPVRLTMAGIFNVVATHEADAIALTSLRQKTRYLFGVDQRLLDHTSLAALHLRVNGADHPELPKELRLTHNPVTSSSRTSNPDDHSGEELRFPITHPTIQSLVQRNMANEAAATIERLVATAHQQIDYAENQPAGSVLTALAEGRGECTDYADLFTTLARAAGFPARNVYGLAYKDGPQPAFMFHAWNEVFSDGKWQAVDPTWNQVQVDASHIPLSDSQAALMMLANNTGRVSFSVLGAEYF